MTEKCCAENWDIAPFTSKHAWVAGIHDEPTGNCIHCGKPYEEWSRQMAAKIIEQHEREYEEMMAADKEEAVYETDEL